MLLNRYIGAGGLMAFLSVTAKLNGPRVLNTLATAEIEFGS
jgi:hypothetical protein